MKVCAGYYRYEMETTLDGEPGTMEVEISSGEDELEGVWIQQIKVGNEVLGEHFHTKRAALDSARRCAELGWQRVPSLGWCLN